MYNYTARWPATTSRAMRYSSNSANVGGQLAMLLQAIRDWARKNAEIPCLQEPEGSIRPYR